MDLKIQISEPALADFEDIVEYSWGAFPAVAERFCNNLLNHIELLAKFPYVGVLVSKRPGVRKIFHSPFMIYYRVQETSQAIEILHIWHG